MPSVYQSMAREPLPYRFMARDDAVFLTDRDYLRSRQYRTDANLAVRQSIYQFQRPKVDLAAAVLDLARLTGTETVADVGCGNGIYLAELTRRGHAGRAIGVDLSADIAVLRIEPQPVTPLPCRWPAMWRTSRSPRTCSTTCRTGPPPCVSYGGSPGPAGG